MDNQVFGQVCSIVNEIPHTLISGVWFWISYIFSNYWFVVVPSIVLWIVIEILTRHNHHYNSANGFTPAFNSFIGGGVFYILQVLINFPLEYFFGKEIYCANIWVPSFHLLPFLATGLLLHGIGFWPYLKLPILNVKIVLFRGGSI